MAFSRQQLPSGAPAACTDGPQVAPQPRLCKPAPLQCALPLPEYRIRVTFSCDLCHVKCGRCAYIGDRWITEGQCWGREERCTEERTVACREARGS